MSRILSRCMIFLSLQTSIAYTNSNAAIVPCDPAKNYDVIIVGAGLAGLTAAKELTHLGRTVLVLEAKSRIGGRAEVGHIKVAGKKERIPLDYGGSWIHGVPTNPLTGMVDAWGLRRERSELNPTFYIDGKRANHQQFDLFNDANEYFENAMMIASEKIKTKQARVDSFCENNNDRGRCVALNKQLRIMDSPAIYLPKGKKYYDVLDLIRENNGPLENGGEFSQTSVVDSIDFATGEDDLVDKGMGTFVSEYGKNVSVCLNSPVAKIDYGKKGIRVQVKNNKSYQGRDALITVSTGVLNKGLIVFHPDLPVWKKKAYQGLPMGFFQKIIIPLKKDIFPLEKMNSWILYEGPIEPDERQLAQKYHKSVKDQKHRIIAFLAKPLGQPVVVGFFGGEWAQIFESECKGKISGVSPKQPCDAMAIHVIKRALSKISHKNIADMIDENEIHVTHWSLDPYTLGAYSYSTPGNWKLHEELRKPITVDNNGKVVPRLFFAGEATANPIYNGSFAGAYQTGLQAARDINVSISSELSDHAD